GIDKLYSDAETRQRVVKQVVGAAVERSGGDDLVAGRGQRGNHQRLSCLARSRCQPRYTTFEGGHALLEHVGRGVHDTRVNVAELLQREKAPCVVGIVKHIGGGLVDRHGARARGGIGGLAGVHGKRGKLLRIFFWHDRLLQKVYVAWLGNGRG